jgi:sortase (surface protein transpeptidase)
MQVPQDPATAGWYDLGPTPGALGPAVIAGHVTWNQTPAVFFRLAELRPGDVVKVARDDHRVAVFEVTRVTAYAKSEFPTRAVYGGIDHAGLRLITCGGEFDRSSDRYSDNIVAFAKLVSTDPKGSPNVRRSEEQQRQDS